MRPIQLSPQTLEPLEALDELYRTARDVRLHQRAQEVLLAVEIGEIVRLSEESVRRWLKRYETEGIEGLKDAPRRGMVAVVTSEVWEYRLGGYPVLKKWLCYREKAVLGRPLKPEEAREFIHIARRIASLLALNEALDCNYRLV